MHPVLARYIDQELTRDVISRAEAGEPVAEEHRYLLEAAKAHAPERRAILRAAGKRLDAAGQQAVLFLATHAALRALRDDPKMQPRLETIDAALREQGAEQQDVDAVLAQVVADEAFGTDEDPGSFHEAWFAESLDSIPRLLALDEQAVDDLLSDFVERAPVADRPLRDRAARALLESAWAEGPSLISIEDLEDAIDALAEETTEKDFPRGALALAEFADLLGERKLVGPVRAERLSRTARNAAAEGGGDAADEDEDEDDDEAGGA